MRRSSDAVREQQDVEDWLRAVGGRVYANAERVPLESVADWSMDPATGAIGHRTGGFFRIEGLSVYMPGAVVPRWDQPIINQPEVGILGILAKEIDGVLHFLMQAKDEPGNRDGVQLAPTVQATRSNFTRVHQGRPVPYLEYFTDTAPHHVIADVRQSEHGAWTLRKRNRNMVVQVGDDAEVESRDGFRWMTAGQVHAMLAVDDVVNMDARTVLACLPFHRAELAGRLPEVPDDFTAALVRSYTREGVHATGDILSWITDLRSETDVRLERTALSGLARWHVGADRITHETGRFFDVVGVKVEASGREVRGWSQPMIETRRPGLVAFLVTRIDGVLHLLVNLRVEPGLLDVAELAPTVQCTPGNYDCLPAAARPVFLDEVLGAPPDRIRADVMLSDEGGRFLASMHRHLVVETDERFDHPGFRWMTLRQFAELLTHSHYVNVQARSLLACVNALLLGPVR
ncbi:NDP-hexose 2,3-dehydratase family protein [Streptosporangium sp. NPDC048865]|uniref:NDP-hexose 2,3-dehydratase family protein n=1 Tax=Streptosporangium sp. NPDC048865 TaxID=3155766 RepID=UPI0034240F15